MNTEDPKPKHPNKVPFSGTLTFIDLPSDMAPNGSRGHRVLLTREAATKALDSLLEMGVGFKADWDGHDARQKCGVITRAWIEGDEVMVSGHLYCRDFPEVLEYLKKPDVKMGMSYELAEAAVDDLREKVWKLTRCIFTGAAILLAHKAAYRNTRFQIHAAEERFTGRLSGESFGRLSVDLDQC